MSKNEKYDKLIKCHNWRKLRELKIKNNPLCEVCGDMATEVHHIKPLLDYRNNEALMQELAYNYDNLQSVCHKCHKQIHFELNKNKTKITTKEINKEKTEDFFKKYLE